MKLFTKVGRRQTRSAAGSAMLLLLLALLGAFMLLPFIYAISQSLKPIEELFIFPPKFFVRNPTIDNFISLFQRTNNMWVPFERYILNSVIMTVIGHGRRRLSPPWPRSLWPNSGFRAAGRMSLSS